MFKRKKEGQMDRRKKGREEEFCRFTVNQNLESSLTQAAVSQKRCHKVH